MGGRFGRAGDDDRLGCHHHVADRLESGFAQRLPGVHDIGDGVGDAEADGDLHGAVDLDDRGLDAAALEVASDDVGVGAGDAQAAEAFGRQFAVPGDGVAEFRAAEAQRHDLGGGRGRVEVQVAAGDADVDDALGDVHGDVARAQEEELDVVLGVGQAELSAGARAAIAGLGDERDGGVRERSLVGECDLEHGESLGIRGAGRRLPG